jgi:hypothetical protein
MFRGFFASIETIAELELGYRLEWRRLERSGIDLSWMGEELMDRTSCRVDSVQQLEPGPFSLVHTACDAK